MKLTVVSWNVLHIIHELNYAFGNSLVLDKYPIESTRITAIFNHIVKKLDKNTIICLQEVPGDLYDYLLKLKSYKVLGLQYTRKPVLKNVKIENPYTNSDEYLVTIIHEDYTKDSNEIFIEDNFGKGALITNINDLYIINAHLPMKSRDDLLIRIKDFIKTINKYIFIGDFNNNQIELRKELDKNNYGIFKMPIFNGDTRKGKHQNGKIVYSKLDHVVHSDNMRICKTQINDNGDISDHYMISIVIVV
jgi:endonuclease/exonuclease/phosphatase family metal-dependent hydrolase